MREIKSSSDDAGKTVVQCLADLRSEFATDLFSLDEVTRRTGLEEESVRMICRELGDFAGLNENADVLEIPHKVIELRDQIENPPTVDYLKRINLWARSKPVIAIVMVCTTILLVVLALLTNVKSLFSSHP